MKNYVLICVSENGRTFQIHTEANDSNEAVRNVNTDERVHVLKKVYVIESPKSVSIKRLK